MIVGLGIPNVAWSDEIGGSPANSSRNELVEANVYPWTAVAKLNNGAGGSCTAIQISPTLALTAAHCLFYRTVGKFLPAESFHLVFGYQKNGFRRHSRVTAYHVSNKYEPSEPYKTLAHDWALLSISPADREYGTTLGAGRPAALSLDTDLMSGGYSHLMPYAMTADQHCKIIGRSTDRRFLFDTCSAPAGYSGAPLLAADPGGKNIRLVGLRVANQTLLNTTAAVAISLESIWPEIKPCVEFGKCDFRVIAGARDQTAAEILSPQRSAIPVVNGSPCDQLNVDCATAMTEP
jgi:protease YdgD